MIQNNLLILKQADKKTSIPPEKASFSYFILVLDLKTSFRITIQSIGFTYGTVKICFWFSPIHSLIPRVPSHPAPVVSLLLPCPSHVFLPSLHYLFALSCGSLPSAKHFLLWSGNWTYPRGSEYRGPLFSLPYLVPDRGKKQNQKRMQKQMSKFCRRNKKDAWPWYPACSQSHLLISSHLRS